MIEEPGILTIAAELEPDGGVLDPSDVLSGKVIAISVHITGVDDFLCYGTGERSDETRKVIGWENYWTYIKCGSEDEMLARAIRYVESLKPKYVRSDSSYDWDFLTARAFKKRIEVEVPDLDAMFRRYDS